MQRFLSIQTTNPNEKLVYMGNRVKVLVEAIGTYHLILDTIYHLDLFQTLYVSSVSQNLVSLSKLDKAKYSFRSGKGCFSFFKHNRLIGFGIIFEYLYKLNLENFFVETFLTLHHNIGTKHGLVNEHSAYLWHKCLGHISK
jgi:hypothetical protein